MTKQIEKMKSLYYFMSLAIAMLVNMKTVFFKEISCKDELCLISVQHTSSVINHATIYF